MKTISTDLSNHLDKEVTSLATCWRIVRKDGQEFFFTDHDQDILFEGDLYEADSSYDRTAIQNNADFSVDNLDVAGVVDSDKISETELRAGLFNRADVYMFLVNWQAPSQGALKLRRGWLGEVTLLNNGTFQSEIRGLAQALSHNFIEVFTSQCRADFCDARCKLNIADFQSTVGVVSSPSRDTLIIGDLSEEPAQPDELHRYWKLDKMTSDTTYIAMAEIQLRSSVGGAALPVTSVNASHVSDYNGHQNQPNRAVDGNPGTLWGTDEDVGGQVWFTLDMGEPIYLAEIAITSRSDAPHHKQTPHKFTLMYSDDGTNWTAARTVETTPFSSPGQTKTFPFTMFSGDFSGELSYGTVEFVDGDNAGRVMEIIGYDEATQRIDLFEHLPYAVTPGTTIKVAPGCDKSLDRCEDYQNVINRRAEDFVPGMDELMRYPDAHS